MSYSQNGEDLIILEYCRDRKIKGTIVEFGANDGITLSNSKLLIDNGWNAILLEPSSVFYDLCKLHEDNSKVVCASQAIGAENGFIDFYESGAHVKNGNDKALVSTINPEEIKRWPNVKFTKKTVSVIDFVTFCRTYVNTDQKLDCISIDVEGLDLDILIQIDLNEVGCKILVIEWNSIPSLARQFKSYCNKFGLKEIHRNAENLIFAL